ncbi:reverse transcriptase domain-containing protein [Tanacetum coccineum]
MDEGTPNQTPAQDAVGGHDGPNDNPVSDTHDAGGPSNPLSEPDTEDPVMQFVVHNFDRMNAMYKAFTQKLKDALEQQTFVNVEPPVIEPWNSDSDDLQPGNTKENAFIESANADPSKSRATIGGTPTRNTAKEKPIPSNDFYHEPFVFKEADRDVRDLVASPFTKWIRDYDMPDEDSQKTQAEILGIRQRPKESLKDYVARFSKETLHMADRSDAMVSGAFISGLRLGDLFKDLIARPPTSLEDMFTQTHNFIRAKDADNENRLREPRRETKQHMVYKDLPCRPRDKPVPRHAARQGENHKLLRDNFTALVKTPAEILATSEGKTMLRPPPKMFTPANKRDRTRYCEFHEDHGHDTNDCIDLRKEIEACIRKGRMAHLAKGAKTQNSNQNNLPSGSKDNSNPQIGWSRKTDTETKPKKRDTYDPSRDDPLIITADVGTTHIHIIYVDGGSSAEIMYEHCFEQLTPEEKKQIRPPTAPLVGFAGQISWPLGLITLPVTDGLKNERNSVQSHPTLHALKQKFETQGSVAEVKGKSFQGKSVVKFFSHRDIIQMRYTGISTGLAETIELPFIPEHYHSLAEKANHSQRNERVHTAELPLPDIDHKIETWKVLSSNVSSWMRTKCLVTTMTRAGNSNNLLSCDHLNEIRMILKFVEFHFVHFKMPWENDNDNRAFVSRKRDHPEEGNDTEVIEHVIVSNAYPEQPLQIAANLPKMLKEKLCEFLRLNQDIFAWKPAYMTGIPQELVEHKLNIHPRTFLVWQKKKIIGRERSEAITAEVSKLVEARILKAVFFPEWVSNPVMVKKTDGTWRMCIDFTSLNKACPKDSYPLPDIDQKIESMEGFKLKCFLDAYKGYHQIRMAKEDEEKTSFHTEQGTFCYEKMSFGLKNAGATYQRLMDNMFTS